MSERDQVVGAYQEILGRTPGEDEVDYWLGQYAGADEELGTDDDWTKDKLEDQFFSSEEYQNLLASGTSNSDRQRRTTAPDEGGGFIGGFKKIADMAVSAGKGVVGSASDFYTFLAGMGKEVMGELDPELQGWINDWMKHRKSEGLIEKWNELQTQMIDKANNLSMSWARKQRQLTPDANLEKHQRPVGKVELRETAPDSGDFQYIVDLDDDGHPERDAEGNFLYFETQDEADTYLESKGGGVMEDVPTDPEGFTLWLNDLGDEALKLEYALRDVQDNFKTDEDWAEYSNAITDYTKTLSGMEGDFIASIYAETDHKIGDAEIKSLDKAREKLVGIVNKAGVDAASAEAFTHAFFTGKLNEQDVHAHRVVGKMLEDSAREISDADYWGAMAVHSAMRDAHDQKLHYFKAAEDEVYNKLVEQKYREGRAGVSTRATRDIARAFLAGRSELSQQLAATNIAIAEDYRRTDVKAAELLTSAQVASLEGTEGAKTAAAQRTLASEVAGEKLRGAADVDAKNRLLKHGDTMTDLRQGAAGQAHKKAFSDLVLPQLENAAKVTNLKTVGDILNRYFKTGEADLGTPQIPEQMMNPDFDWWGKAMDVLSGKAEPTGNTPEEKEASKLDTLAQALGLIAGLTDKIADPNKKPTDGEAVTPDFNITIHGSTATTGSSSVGNVDASVGNVDVKGSDTTFEADSIKGGDTTFESGAVAGGEGGKGGEGGETTFEAGAVAGGKGGDTTFEADSVKGGDLDISENAINVTGVESGGIDVDAGIDENAINVTGVESGGIDVDAGLDIKENAFNVTGVAEDGISFADQFKDAFDVKGGAGGAGGTATGAGAGAFKDMLAKDSIRIDNTGVEAGAFDGMISPEAFKGMIESGAISVTGADAEAFKGMIASDALSLKIDENAINVTALSQGGKVGNVSSTGGTALTGDVTALSKSDSDSTSEGGKSETSQHIDELGNTTTTTTTTNVDNSKTVTEKTLNVTDASTETTTIQYDSNNVELSRTTTVLNKEGDITNTTTNQDETIVTVNEGDTTVETTTNNNDGRVTTNTTTTSVDGVSATTTETSDADGNVVAAPTTRYFNAEQKELHMHPDGKLSTFRPGHFSSNPNEDAWMRDQKEETHEPPPGNVDLKETSTKSGDPEGFVRSLDDDGSTGKGFQRPDGTWYVREFGEPPRDLYDGQSFDPGVRPGSSTSPMSDEAKAALEAEKAAKDAEVKAAAEQVAAAAQAQADAAAAAAAAKTEAEASAAAQAQADAAAATQAAQAELAAATKKPEEEDPFDPFAQAENLATARKDIEGKTWDEILDLYDTDVSNNEHDFRLGEGEAQALADLLPADQWDKIPGYTASSHASGGLTYASDGYQLPELAKEVGGREQVTITPVDTTQKGDVPVTHSSTGEAAAGEAAATAGWREDPVLGLVHDSGEAGWKYSQELGGHFYENPEQPGWLYDNAAQRWVFPKIINGELMLNPADSKKWLSTTSYQEYKNNPSALANLPDARQQEDGTWLHPEVTAAQDRLASLQASQAQAGDNSAIWDASIARQTETLDDLRGGIARTTALPQTTDPFWGTIQPMGLSNDGTPTSFRTSDGSLVMRNVNAQNGANDVTDKGWYYHEKYGWVAPQGNQLWMPGLGEGGRWVNHNPTTGKITYAYDGVDENGAVTKAGEAVDTSNVLLQQQQQAPSIGGYEADATEVGDDFDKLFNLEGLDGDGVGTSGFNSEKLNELQGKIADFTSDQNVFTDLGKEVDQSGGWRNAVYNPMGQDPVLDDKGQLVQAPPFQEPEPYITKEAWGHLGYNPEHWGNWNTQDRFHEYQDRALAESLGQP